MTRTRSRRALGCALYILLAVAVAACGAGAASSRASGSDPGRPGASPDAAGPANGSASPAPSLSAAPNPPAAAPGADASPGAVATGPSPAVLPWTPSPDVPVDAVVSPACVRPGGTMKLTVRTRPKAGLAYIAIYADNGTGAPKPYGAGYGGNDKGITDPQGGFTSVWVVSLTAPAGPARVDVIVGWNNMWGYDGPTFEVAGPNGAC